MARAINKQTVMHISRIVASTAVIILSAVSASILNYYGSNHDFAGLSVLGPWESEQCFQSDDKLAVEEHSTEQDVYSGRISTQRGSVSGRESSQLESVDEFMRTLDEEDLISPNTFVSSPIRIPMSDRVKRMTTRSTAPTLYSIPEGKVPNFVDDDNFFAHDLDEKFEEEIEDEDGNCSLRGIKSAKTIHGSRFNSSKEGTVNDESKTERPSSPRHVQRKRTRRRLRDLTMDTEESVYSRNLRQSSRRSSETASTDMSSASDGFTNSMWRTIAISASQGHSRTGRYSPLRGSRHQISVLDDDFETDLSLLERYRLSRHLNESPTSIFTSNGQRMLIKPDQHPIN